MSTVQSSRQTIRRGTRPGARIAPRPRRTTLHWPATAAVSGLAALTTWLTLLAWTPFAERPSSYMVPLLGTCLLIAAAGALLRSARLPALPVLAVQILIVGLWLNNRWAGAEAWGGWLPTPESLREMGATVTAAVEIAQTYAAPIPKGVTAFAPLMVIAGTGTALIVDFIAGGLRRAPVAGLPLLAVYTAPVSILEGGVSWLKFAAAALAFLFLLAAQEAARLGRWGQQVSGRGQVSDTQDTRVSGQAVWSSARKIGVTATGAAVLVPIIVPTFALDWFDGLGNGPGGDGDSVSLSNPILNMRRDLARGDDVDLVRVTTEEPTPGYLRLSVLDSFDGETWRPASRNIPVDNRANGLLPRPPGLDSDIDREIWPWQITVSEGFDSDWLPAPYPTYAIDAEGEWRYDVDTLDFISADDDQTAAGLSYELRSIDLQATAEQIADAGAAPGSIFGPGTELPEDMPESVEAIALRLTEDKESNFEKAVALQNWFRSEGGFEYSLDRAPGNGLEALEEFLSPGGRVGYCEQFAAAMALMGRTLDIPSRVAVGFLKPDPVGNDTFVFSSHDLHAWPELYFDGVGWVRFEPTPGVRTGAAPGYTEAAVQEEETASSAPEPRGVQAPGRINDTRLPDPQTAAGGSGSGGGRLPLGVAGGVLAVAAIGALPRLVRELQSRRRWAAASTPGGLAEAAWAELRATAMDLRLPWDDDITVRARARDLVRAFGRPGADDDALSRPSVRGLRANPAANDALERLVHRVELARYSRAMPASAAVRAEVERDLNTCLEALRAGASRRQRTTATWLPASLWSEWTLGPRSRRQSQVSFEEPGIDHAI